MTARQQKTKIQKHIQELETDDKKLMGKIELKHKDIYLGIDRYIKAS